MATRGVGLWQEGGCGDSSFGRERTLPVLPQALEASVCLSGSLDTLSVGALVGDRHAPAAGTNPPGGNRKLAVGKKAPGESCRRAGLTWAERDRRGDCPLGRESGQRPAADFLTREPGLLLYRGKLESGIPEGIHEPHVRLCCPGGTRVCRNCEKPMGNGLRGGAWVTARSPHSTTATTYRCPLLAQVYELGMEPRWYYQKDSTT